ncbi:MULTISPECIES: hypothetical protein [unclassified Haladaptatus]|uniref:hypothetical protein n=1 Tax=unclassified Haladaptatus TaxID=2622732 RepID=UPI0007B4D5CF|nr:MULTISPECIES: hypothetical protein [unclassified Haladaptatus]KZN22731.1 hypothetical protein A4G99_18490 [Haladaptatus sp. R4]MCO8245802.1 hypothetical protein [Haladaptatus sp. AB643]MCO8256149.1 hypothetical protein [Haladaptatus sp. AB618]
MNPSELDRRLRERFDAPEGARRVVVREARDLSDSGRYRKHAGIELTASAIVGHLEDAPDDMSLPEKWNWWVGSLEIAYGGYTEFLVVRWQGSENQ